MFLNMGRIYKYKKNKMIGYRWSGDVMQEYFKINLLVKPQFKQNGEKYPLVGIIMFLLVSIITHNPVMQTSVLKQGINGRLITGGAAYPIWSDYWLICTNKSD